MDTLKLYREEYSLRSNEVNFIVDWEQEDIAKNPLNWSKWKRFNCTVFLAFISFLVTLASSIGSGTYESIMADFKVTREVAGMTTSLFLVGFAIGAPVLAPLCEEFGRLPVYIVSMLGFSCFQIGAATSKKMASLSICRFFAGFFGTTPLSNAGGSIADMWEPDKRTLTFPFFGVSGFLGPCLGPVIGSYLSVSDLGWRSTNYLVAILGFFFSLTCFCFMPETYGPIIMDLKAASIRRTIGDKRYISYHELQRKGRSPFSLKVFMRPLLFAIGEPIVTCFTACISLTYIVLFSDFESFPVIFATWGFSTAKSSLPFIAVTVGILCNLFLVTPIAYIFYMKEVKEKGYMEKVDPESRLIPLMFCCWFIPISLFWISWTTYESISPWSSIISTFFFGVGMMQVFLTTYSYIIDAYGVNSASALSSLTLVRYNVSAAMIHITEPMYKNLGIHWAACLLGFLSLIICAVPFVFYVFGPKIRLCSKFTVHSENGK